MGPCQEVIFRIINQLLIYLAHGISLFSFTLLLDIKREVWILSAVISPPPSHNENS